MGKKYTGERLETHEMGQGRVEHLHRYGIAMDQCRGKNVLDIASGEGYGSALLATVAGNVTGVDISAEVVKEANQKYAAKFSNLQYLEGSTDKIPADDRSFDVVVSFETIEHHDQHITMMQEIKRVLKPGGLLIISSPDKLYYSDKPGTVNPFHVKELYKGEFENLLKEYFKSVDLYRQKAFFSSVLVPDKPQAPVGSSTRFYEGSYTSIGSENEMESVYLLAMASDSLTPKLDLSLFRDYDFIDNMRKRLESTTRFKFGNMILNPVQFFKQKIFGNK